MNTHRIVPAVVLCASALATACASYQHAPEVTAQMARTEATLQQARQGGAQVEALPQLQSARDKYAQAQQSLEKNSKEGDREAVQLAKQAELDAQFAAAKAQTSRQEKAASEVQQGVEALRSEANRSAAGSAEIAADKQ
jgi:hypothetical protein